MCKIIEMECFLCKNLKASFSSNILRLDESLYLVQGLQYTHFCSFFLFLLHLHLLILFFSSISDLLSIDLHSLTSVKSKSSRWKRSDSHYFFEIPFYVCWSVFFFFHFFLASLSGFRSFF